MCCITIYTSSPCPQTSSIPHSHLLNYHSHPQIHPHPSHLPSHHPYPIPVSPNTTIQFMCAALPSPPYPQHFPFNPSPFTPTSSPAHPPISHLHSLPYPHVSHRYPHFKFIYPNTIYYAIPIHPNMIPCPSLQFPPPSTTLSPHVPPPFPPHLHIPNTIHYPIPMCPIIIPCPSSHFPPPFTTPSSCAPIISPTHPQSPHL